MRSVRSHSPSDGTEPTTTTLSPEAANSIYD